MSRYMIELSPVFTTPPLSLNRKMHWAKENRIKADLRTLVRARCHIPPAQHIDVWLRWQPRVKRNRDGDNPMPTVKPCVDQLVAQGVVPDDTTQHVTHRPLELLEASRDRTVGLWLMVETR
jgi:crossover junction endodeoxyribonuclease RusA